jgi:hypothetical protein
MPTISHQARCKMVGTLRFAHPTKLRQPRSPGEAQRNPGQVDPRLKLSRVALRFIRATG